MIESSNYIMDQLSVDKIFSDEIPTIPHWSAPAMVVGWICSVIDSLRVLELGTGYGSQLPYILPHAGHVTSVDVMYDWVPDLTPEQRFEQRLVDKKKLDDWKSFVAPWQDKIDLIIGSTHEVHVSHTEQLSTALFDILIVDACHHPVAAVEADFWNYRRFMAPEFFVIFDDMQQSDPEAAKIKTVDRLISDGHYVRARDVKNGGITSTIVHVVTNS